MGPSHRFFKLKFVLEKLSCWIQQKPGLELPPHERLCGGNYAVRDLPALDPDPEMDLGPLERVKTLTALISASNGQHSLECVPKSQRWAH